MERQAGPEFALAEKLLHPPSIGAVFVIGADEAAGVKTITLVKADRAPVPLDETGIFLGGASGAGWHP